MRLFIYILLLACLNLTGQANATIHRIPSGVGKISAILPQLAAHDTLMLTGTGGGVYHETEDVDIRVPNLTIMASPTAPSPPIWTVDDDRIIEAYESLTLIGIHFNGRDHSDFAIRAQLLPQHTLRIENCTFYAFLEDAITDDNTPVGRCEIRNSIFHHIAQTAVEFKTPDMCRELIVENSTFYHIGERAIHVAQNKTPQRVEIKNVTIYDCLDGIFLDQVSNITLTHTIITHCRNFGVRIKPGTNPPTLAYNCTFENRKDYLIADTPLLNSIQEDPLFFDPLNGNFSLLPDSPVLAAGQNSHPIGDLRWTGTATTQAGRLHLLQTWAPIIGVLLLFVALIYGASRFTRQTVQRRAYRHVLERSQTTLEARVARRTQELKRANEQLQIEISQRQQIEQTLRDTYDALEQQMTERTQELKATKDDLQLRNEQLQQAQKLEAIGQLAGGIAHDFNNNLAIIRGYVDMAIEQVSSSTPLHRYLSNVNEAVQRSARLTGQLLIFSSKQPVEPQALNLNENVKALEDMFKRLLGEDITIQLSLEENIWPVMADSGNIDQIITNLAVNARDAMPEGGTLQIATANKHLQTPTHPDAHPGRYVCLSVTDNGIGMSDEVQSHLFEPFYTTKEKGSGTGLGLAIIYGIVQAHHGWIDVTSETGKGTTFDIYLPMEDTLLQDEDTTHTEQIRQGKKEHILLIEDEPALRVMKQSILEGHNYQVTPCASCTEAKETFATHNGQFDLIFSDIILPDGRGTDLVGEFSQKHPNIAILLATGYTDDRADWDKARQAGWPVLQKPVSVKNLLAEIHKALTSKHT